MSHDSDPPSSSSLSSRVAIAAVAALLLVHAALAQQTAFRNSVTNDEFWHVPTGLWNVTTGEFHYENLNPPLVRVLSALPLLAAGAERGVVDDDASKEERGDAFVKANRERYSHLISLSRMVPVLLSVATGCLLACWAWELFGKGAAVMAAALWSLSPNVIAHASLVTTDAAAAGAMLMIVRSAWKFSHRPTWKRALWLGFWLGLAQLVKYTCLLGFPFALATWFIHRLKNDRVIATSSLRAIALWIGAASCALLVVNLGYLFHGSGRPLRAYRFQSHTFQSLASTFSFANRLPVPLPSDYLEGIDHQRNIMEGAHPVYLDGEMRFEGGFRDYYLKAWWYKTPHATQVACLLAVLVWWWPGRTGRQHRVQLALLLPVLFLLYVASRSSMQLGLRYLLPVYPLLFLFASQTASVGSRVFGLPQLLALLLGIGLASSLRHHPHHLAYFNELAGGPEQGHLHLLDSNIDWGQGLLELKSYMEDEQIDEVGLAYFGSVNPADLGISFHVAPQSDPPEILWPALKPGTYAISANFLMGRPGNVRSPEGATYQCNAHQFGYFRIYEPDEHLGNCIFIFQMSADDIALMPEN